MASVNLARKMSANMNMCEGPLFKKIIRFTFPIILTNLLQLMFNAADLLVVGQFCGSTSVAAVGSTSSLVHLAINFFLGISSGVGVVTAMSIGAGEEKNVQKTVHSAIPIALLCGALLTVVGLLGVEPMLRLMDTPSDILPLSALYLKIYFCGMIPSMLYNFGAAILRADGDTKRPLFYLTFAGVVNVVLNLFFVIVLDMDVAGVAIATAVSQLVSAVLVLWALMKKNDACRLDVKKMRFHSAQVGQILKIGLPAGLQSTTFSFSNVIIQSSINSFGAIAVAGSAAASTLEGFVYTPIEAYSQAALNFTGQNFGAKKYDRIKRILLITIASCIVTELVLGVLANVFSTPLLSLYITDSVKAIGYGAKRMLYISLFYFLCGTMGIFSAVFRGMGHSVTPMFINIFSNCVFRVVWIFCVFRFLKSWDILFSSYPISWALAIAVQIVMYIIIMKKYKKSASLFK